MTAFRIIEPFQVFTDQFGNLDFGGYLEFYAAGTTTPKDTYGNKALSVNNGPTIAIGTDGRPVVDIWGEGGYRARLYASDGTLIPGGDRDNIEIPGGDGTTIPALVDGQFLTNDGATLQWDNVEQVPDPTGQSGKLLSSDGANPIWIPAPAAPEAPITVGASSVQFGSTDGKAWLIQQGKDTAPASGTNKSTKSVTFPVPFNSVPVVVLTMNSDSQPGGPVVAQLSGEPTATGFTATFDIAEGNSSQSTFVNDAPFGWRAEGTVNV